MTLRDMYGYKRRTICYTIVKMSYTDYTGKRIKDVEVKIDGICTSNKFEVYNVIKKRYNKAFVSEVVSNYYWEE